jgi:pimeloyl-ACP methyl ester carboxylesterase
MRATTRQRLRLAGGTELSCITAGDASKPALLLLHGFPGSAGYFREVVPELSQATYVIAPDLPRLWRVRCLDGALVSRLRSGHF